MPALQIVHLEDDDADAQRVADQLHGEGVAAEIVRVRNKSEFAEQIDRPELDLILADCHCSCFEGFDALSLARTRARRCHSSSSASNWITTTRSSRSAAA
jgi:CheY-like chemotaxis protein